MHFLSVVCLSPVNERIVYNQTQITYQSQSLSSSQLYLSQFGYLSPKYRNPTSGNLLDQDTWEKAIMEFQSFAGLNVTGELDGETMQLMSLPRCGVKDKVGFGSDTRSKRYALQGSRWKVKDLTYRISKYPRRLERTAVDKEIAKAFGVWSEYTDLRFTPKKTGAVHIDIRFEENEHGDGDPFDGPGGTLAHAYFPVYGGDAHFDDAEQWTIDKPRGTNLFQVAAHEFGHSLGLSHSDVRSALMAPFYRGYDPVFRLDSDDIQVGQSRQDLPVYWKFIFTHGLLLKQGIQTLYGTKTRNPGGGAGATPTRTPRPKTPTEMDSELCTSPKIDAIFNTADGSTYAFKGDKYYKLTENAVAEGYPKKISDGWPGLPGIGLIFSQFFFHSSNQTFPPLSVTLQATSMPRLRTKMARLTSSRAPSTGGTRAARSTATTPRRSAKVSPACPTISMQRWYGAATARSTSTKGANSGGSIR